MKGRFENSRTARKPITNSAADSTLKHSVARMAGVSEKKRVIYPALLKEVNWKKKS
jgi:hypothetical protein